MSALTSPRSTWSRKIPIISLPMPSGQTCWVGSEMALDTANPGLVYPATGGVSTQTPIGKSLSSVANASGGNLNVNVELNEEVTCRNWDSVTGGGAVTIANQLAEVYIASDHEVTTTAGSNGKAGRVWDVNGDGVWVQGPFLGQSTF
jgi:hypothetical protein